MVNQALSLFEAPNLHEVSVHYPLSDWASCFIDSGVAFAFATGVSRLELNFSDLGHGHSFGSGKNYSILLDLFDKQMELLYSPLVHVRITSSLLENSA